MKRRGKFFLLYYDICAYYSSLLSYASDANFFTCPDVSSLCSILKEVSILLEALEKRQLELERENKQLKEDLSGAARLLEEGDNMRKILEKQLTEKEEQLAEKKDIVFVEHEHSK